MASVAFPGFLERDEAAGELEEREVVLVFSSTSG